MYRQLKRFGMVLLASLALMSFRLGPETGERDRLIYDVRGAFVAARPDVSPELMQSIHYQVANAINDTVRVRARPRVVLTIRLESYSKGSLLLGQRASVKAVVRAAAVQTGEVIAEAKFTVTAIGIDASSIERDLAFGVAERVISEFKLNRTAPSTLATALFPGSR